MDTYIKAPWDRSKDSVSIHMHGIHTKMYKISTCVADSGREENQQE